jgi:tRNA-specific adenosine deaminase 3
MNIVRDIADFRASGSNDVSPSPTHDSLRNGSNYLLTDMTLFMTHEPCIMCSMALLHSRVKTVIYLVPMEKTGGCGGLACVSKLEGVNHRFQILKWDISALDVVELQINPDIDT